MPITVRSSSGLVVLLLALVASLLGPAASADAGPVTTTLRDLTPARGNASGTLGLLGYTAAHDIHGEVAPGGHLDGLRIDRDAQAESMAGAWGQGGELGAWLGPPTTTPAAQFVPTSTLVESLYLEDRVGDTGATLVAGDRAELAMAVLPMDSVLDPNTPRGATGGRPGWDRSVVTSSVSAQFQGRTGRLDVIEFRADVVVRGGDLDARRQAVAMEPLTIPLGRAYPDGVQFVGLAGVAGPSTQYVSDLTLAVAPSAGSAVLRASVTGYIPEARTRTLSNGAVIKEWHIPITGVIGIDTSGSGDSGLVPQVAMRLPDTAAVLAVSPLGHRRLAVDAGELLSASPTASGPGVHAAAAVAGDDTAVPASAGPSTTGDGMEGAALVRSSLSAPVVLGVPAAGLSATIDPDHRGEGVLAVRDVRSTWLAQTYARSATVPVVEVGDRLVRLDRSNLVDLRALPVSVGGGVRVGLLTSGEDPPPQLTVDTRLPDAGLRVDAVHDLGGGTYAFLTHQVFNGGVPAGGRLNTSVSIRSLSSPIVTVRPRFHVELEERGPVSQATTVIETERTVSSGTRVAVADHRVDAVYRDPSIRSGLQTVLRAPAPLDGRLPDPSLTVADQPIAVVIGPPATGPREAPEQMATFRAGLAEGPAFGPASPPVLGQRCGPAQVVDVPSPDGAPSGDVVAAWFDDDPQHVYATIQLREVPRVATAPTGDLYAVHWREGHVTYVARALLQPSGVWRFDVGVLGSFVDPTTGDVQPGANGVIRIAVPRGQFDLRNGALLRDVAAHSFVGTTTVRRDHAPKGSTTTFGLGPDVVVGGCRPLPLDLAVAEVPAVVTGEQATLRARALDPAGQPVPGLLVDLSVEGPGASTPVTARTRADGWAQATVPVTALPGQATVRAAFPGDGGSYAPAVAEGVVQVLHRPTALTAREEGSGINRVLVARLSDGLTGAGLAGRTVRFTADDVVVGVATTDADGIARLRADVVPRGGRAYAATFDGDERYAASTAAIR